MPWNTCRTRSTRCSSDPVPRRKHRGFPHPLADLAGGTDSLDQDALGRLAGNHDRSILAAGQGRLAAIKPKSRFLFLAAVAAKAVGSKQWKYIRFEIDLFGCRCHRGPRQQDQQGKRERLDSIGHGQAGGGRRDDCIVVREVTARQVS